MVRSQISAAFLSEDLEKIAKVGSDRQVIFIHGVTKSWNVNSIFYFLSAFLSEVNRISKAADITMANT